MKKILIYRNCSLGDFIVSLPAINLIKKINPNSKLYLASQIRTNMAYVKPNSIPLNKNLIDKFIYFKYGVKYFFNFLNKIKKIKFDKVYYLNAHVSNFKLIRDYLVFKFFGINKINGIKYQKFNYEKHNETYYLCKRIKEKINKKDLSIKDFLYVKKNLKKKKYITLSFGGKNPLKKWKFENWKNLVKKLISIYPNLEIIIVGSKYEYLDAEKIRYLKKSKIFNLCGKTSIKNLVNVIGNSNYHISHDDGTMHIASTFYKKGIAIFGKSTAKKGRWFPKNPNLKIFYENYVNDIDLNLVIKKIIYDIKNF